jgi:hypothetical protein
MRRRQEPPTTEAARDALQRARYAEHRLQWLERLDRDEPAATAGATPHDARVIRRLFDKARKAWPEEMPEGWQVPGEPVEIDQFHIALGLVRSQHGGRYRPSTFRAGEQMPDGRVVGKDQTETVPIDVGIDFAEALLAQARREASPPPEPEPEPERQPPARFTDAGILAALTMPPGTFTGTGSYEPAGERDPRQVGALGQVERD